MPTDVPNPIFRQILRAALGMAADALSMLFTRKKAIRFTSAGQSIRGFFYSAGVNSKMPGVLLLPTARGLTPHEHALAARLAREGFTTLVIAYSKRTTGAVVRDELRRKHLEEIVIAGWRVLQENPLVDPART